MVKKFAELQRIDNDHPITKESDGLFVKNLQHGLLLTLREQGYLSDPELRLAEEKLDQQWRNSS